MSRVTFFVLLLLKLAALTLIALHCWTAAAIVFFVPDGWVLYHLFVPSAQGLCRSFTRFQTSAPEVWLTIDDGPDPVDTPQILDVLDHHQAKATFFLIGQRAAAQPDLVAEIHRRGHEVGHHTQTHPIWRFWCLSKPRLHAELDATLDVLRGFNLRPRWFRSPVGIKNFLLPAALADRQLACVGWSVRSGDCHSRGPESVVARVLRHARPGSIILMHEGPSVPSALRVKAIAGVLAGLTAKHYRCVLPTPDQLR